MRILMRDGVQKTGVSIGAWTNLNIGPHRQRQSKMSKDLGYLLRNGAADLVAMVLSRNGLETELPPTEKKLRTKWAGVLLLGLQGVADALLAGLTEEARRIVGLSEARFDWMFVRTAWADDRAEWLRLNSLDRSLWFFLNELDTFEQIERRA